MRRRLAGRRALDVHHWVHMCSHMCVRSSACMCMHRYARMRRMHSSVGVRARDGGGAERWAAQGGDLHLDITMDMYKYVCAYARMHTCMRVLVECISACVGVGACACVRGGSGRPLCVTMYVHACI
jgi:hypothetical protein